MNASEPLEKVSDAEHQSNEATNDSRKFSPYTEGTRPLSPIATERLLWKHALHPHSPLTSTLTMFRYETECSRDIQMIEKSEVGSPSCTICEL